MPNFTEKFKISALTSSSSKNDQTISSTSSKSKSLSSLFRLSRAKPGLSSSSPSITPLSLTTSTASSSSSSLLPSHPVPKPEPQAVGSTHLNPSGPRELASNNTSTKTSTSMANLHVHVHVDEEGKPAAYNLEGKSLHTAKALESGRPDDGAPPLVGRYLNLHPSLAGKKRLLEHLDRCIADQHKAEAAKEAELLRPILLGRVVDMEKLSGQMCRFEREPFRYKFVQPECELELETIHAIEWRYVELSHDIRLYPWKVYDNPSYFYRTSGVERETNTQPSETAVEVYEEGNIQRNVSEEKHRLSLLFEAALKLECFENVHIDSSKIVFITPPISNTMHFNIHVLNYILWHNYFHVSHKDKKPGNIPGAADHDPHTALHVSTLTNHVPTRAPNVSQKAKVEFNNCLALKFVVVVAVAFATSIEPLYTFNELDNSEKLLPDKKQVREMESAVRLERVLEELDKRIAAQETLFFWLENLSYRVLRTKSGKHVTHLPVN